MLHKESGASLISDTAPTSLATKPDVLAIFPHASDVERQQRQRRARALLRVADRLERHHPESAALARAWATGRW